MTEQEIKKQIAVENNVFPRYSFHLEINASQHPRKSTILEMGYNSTNLHTIIEDIKKALKIYEK